MQHKTPQIRVLLGYCHKLVGLLVFGVFLFLAVFTAVTPQKASAVAPSTLNFQARLMTATGAIVPDGNYNVEFKLYNSATLVPTPDQGACTRNSGTPEATCLWTETRTGGNVVQVKNGYLTVNLGSVNTALSAIDFSQQLWLTMRIGGIGAPSWDPEMNPRLLLTGVPYAFKAADSATLGGIASSGFIQNQTASPQATSGFNISGNGLIGGNATVTGTYNTNTFTGSALTFGSAGTATIQSASSQALNITGNAASTFGTSAGNLTLQASSGNILLNTTNASGGTVVKSVTSNSATAFQVQNASSNSVLTVDTSAGAVGLGTSSSITGKLVFQNAGNANSVTIQSGTTAAGGYTLTLPTTAPALSQCLQNDGTTVGTLVFASCFNGTITGVGTYVAGNTNANGATVSGSNIVFQSASASAPGMIDTAAQTIAGLKTFNAGLNIASGQAFQIAATNVLTSSNLTLTAAGATTVQSVAGATSQNITVQSGNASAGVSGTVTVDNGTFTSGTPTLNLGNANAKTIQVGNSTNTTTFGLDLAAGGTLNIANGAQTHTINVGAGAAVQTIHIGDGAAANVVAVGSGSGAASTAINAGTAGLAIGNNGIANTIQVGNTTGAVAQTVNVGNNATAGSTTTTTVGSTVGSSATTVQAGTGNINLVTNASGSGTFVKTNTNSTTGFQVQNATGDVLFTGDTTNVATYINNGGLSLFGTYAVAAPTLTSNGAGGTLAAATYGYGVAAIGVNGNKTQTVSSTPGNVTTTGTTSKNTLTWSASSGAKGYRIWRTTNGGTTYFYNDVSAATTSIVDNGSTYTWATSGTPTTVNQTTGINLASDSNLILDAGSGNFGATLSYSSQFKSLTLANYNAGGVVSLTGDSLTFQDSTGYNFNLSIANTGATTFKNRVNSASAFQVQNSGGVTQFNVDTTTGTASAPIFNATVGFSANGVGGITGNCGLGQYVQGAFFAFGLQTNGSCATAGTLSGVGTYSTTNTNANGATVSGANLIFQSASASAPGMIDTGAQTIAGLKTFNAGLNIASGQAYQINTANVLTSSNLTLTAASATTLQSVAGATSQNITVQSGNASAGVSGVVTVDNGTFTSGTPTLNLGNTNAATIQIGNTTNTTTVGLDLASGGTLNIANGAQAHTINIGAGAAVQTVHIGDGAAANVVTVGSSTGAASTTINAGTAGLAVGNNGVANTIQVGNTTGAVAQTVNIGSNATGGSTSTVVIGSTVAGNITLQSAATIAIGNNAAAQTLNIGNITGATAINERVGTGNYSLDGVAGSNYALGASTTTGAITIGGTAQTGTMTLGSSSGTNILNIAAGAGATTLNLANAQTAGSVNIGAAMITGTITIGGTGAQTGTISIGTGTGAQTLNFGTGNTAAKTVTVGSQASTSTTTIDSGTGGVNIGNSGANKTINIGVTAATANTTAVNIATSTGAAQTIKLGGTGASGGSNVGSAVSFQGGATVLNVNNAGTNIQTFTNSTTAFQVLNANSTPLFSVDTTAPANNLITNPGFEVNTTGWSNKNTGSLTRVTTAAALYYGVAAGQLATGTAANNGASFAVALTLGTTYNLSFYARSSGTAATGINFGYTNTGGDQDCSTANVIYTTGFTRYTCSFTVTTTAGTAIYIKQTGTTTQTIYLDGFQLLSGATAPSAYGLGTTQLRGIVNTPVVLQNANNSTTALQVLNAAGNAVLSVDTQNQGIVTGNNGTPNPFVTNANNSNVGHSYAQVATWGGYAFIVGNGPTIGVDSTATYYAKINGDGSLSPWVAESSVLPKFVAANGIVAVNGYLYSITGDQGTTASNGVPANVNYYAKINIDGTIGAWVTMATAFPASYNVPAVTTSGGYIYVMGGTAAHGGIGNNTVYYAKPNPDGNITAWSTSSNPVIIAAAAQNREDAMGASSSNYIYEIGGTNNGTGGTVQTTVLYASVNPNGGANSTWTAATALPVAVEEGIAAVSNGYLYVMAGDNGTTPSSAVYYAKINGDGSIGSWTTSVNTLPAAVSNTQGFTYNGHLYVISGTSDIAGSSSVTTVYRSALPRAKIGSNLDLLYTNAGSGSGSGSTAQTVCTSNCGATISSGDINVQGNIQATGSGSFNAGLNVAGSSSFSGNVFIGGASLCVKSTQAACAIAYTSGSIETTTAGATGADYAENYVSSQDLKPGDLVKLAKDGNNAAVVKTTSNNGYDILGVVSTAPGFTVNSEAAADPTHPYIIPIALSGRVPVKVSNANGVVHAGDPLTASSVSGVAVKATGLCYVLGRALEDSPVTADPNTPSSILGFINLSYYNGTATGGDLQTSGSDTLSIAATPPLQGIGSFTSIDVSGSAALATLNVTGEANFEGNVSLGSVFVKGDLKLGGHIVTTGSTPTFALQPYAGLIAPQMPASADPNTPLQHIAKATIVGNDTSGKLTITIGDIGADIQPGDVIKVTFSKAYDGEPQVIASPRGKDAAQAQFYVNDVTGQYFTIAAAGTLKAGTTYTINYFSVQ